MGTKTEDETLLGIGRPLLLAETPPEPGKLLLHLLLINSNDLCHTQVRTESNLLSLEAGQQRTYWAASCWSAGSAKSQIGSRKVPQDGKGLVWELVLQKVQNRPQKSPRRSKRLKKSHDILKALEKSHKREKASSGIGLTKEYLQS